MQLQEIDFTEIITQILNGDNEGFTILYQNTYAYYRGIVKKYFSNPEEIEDLLQEIYIKIFTGLKTLKDTEKFLPWSKTIVKNEIKNELKKKSKKIITNTENYPLYKEEDSDCPSLEELAFYSSDKEFNRRTYMKDYQPEMYLEESERKQILEKILSQLPFMQKTCILLWQEGFSTKEIAEELEISDGAVLVNIHYSKKKIEQKAEELKSHGLIIRSVTPFPFFLWLLDQYDLSLDYILVGIGDMELWKKIKKKASDTSGITKKRRFRTVNASAVLKGIVGFCVIAMTGFSIYYYGFCQQTTGNESRNQRTESKENDKDTINITSEKEKPQQEQTKNNLSKETLQKEEKDNANQKTEHTHDYNVPIKETIYHDAVGHTEKVWIEDEAAWDEDIYEAILLCGCGEKFKTTSAWDQHSIDGCPYGYSVKKEKVGTKHHDAVGHYEEQWVVDQEAWKEIKTVGWKCSCGEVKK